MNRFEWSSQVVLVTGGTRGIGMALVRGLAARGAQVIATGRQTAGVEAARVRLEADGVRGVSWQVCELTDPASRAALVPALEAVPLSMVIHNAGVQQRRDFSGDPGAEAIRESEEIETNLLAPIEISRGLLPALQRHPQAAIVFITSGLALAPKASSPVYCATKAALRSFAKALRAQLSAGANPVRVVEALPPIVDTDMTRGRGSRKLSADEAARQILQGIEAGRDEIDVGATRLLRLLMRLSPALGERLMIAR